MIAISLIMALNENRIILLSCLRVQSCIRWYNYVLNWVSGLIELNLLSLLPEWVAHFWCLFQQRRSLGPIQCNLALSSKMRGSLLLSSTCMWSLAEDPDPHVFQDLWPKGLLFVFLASHMLCIFNFHLLHWVLFLRYMGISLSWFKKWFQFFTQKYPVLFRYMEMPLQSNVMFLSSFILFNK